MNFQLTRITPHKLALFATVLRYAITTLNASTIHHVATSWTTDLWGNINFCMLSPILHQLFWRSQSTRSNPLQASHTDQKTLTFFTSVNAFTISQISFQLHFASRTLHCQTPERISGTIRRTAVTSLATETTKLTRLSDFTNQLQHTTPTFKAERIGRSGRRRQIPIFKDLARGQKSHDAKSEENGAIT